MASVARALLDEHEREMQERLLRGPPPLDRARRPRSASPPSTRAMVELLERHGHLALAAETGDRRYHTGAYRGWRLHVGALLAEAGLGDHPALVDALLAPLAPEVFAHQRASGSTAEEIAAALTVVAHKLLQA